MRKRSMKLNFDLDELTRVSELNQQVLSLGRQMEEAVRESAKKDEALKRVESEKAALESTSQLPFNLGKTYMYNDTTITLRYHHNITYP